MTIAHALIVAIAALFCVQCSSCWFVNASEYRGPVAKREAPKFLQIGSDFGLMELAHFPKLSGCEWDSDQVVSCSVVGSYGELYVIFEGIVVRVDVEVTAPAFMFPEFSGLSSRSDVEGVKRWSQSRSSRIVAGSPPDAPEAFSVLALGFMSRWCNSGCHAIFLFSDSGDLQTIRIAPNEPFL